MVDSREITRSWRVIAEQLANEHNSQKLSQLAEELNTALSAQGNHSRRRDSFAGHDGNGGLKLQNPHAILRHNNSIPAFLQSVIHASGADFGDVQLLDSSENALKIVAQQGFGDEFLDHFGAVRCDSNCSCGAAMSLRSRVVVADVSTDPTFEGASREMLLRANVRSVQSTPLFDRNGNLIGVVSTHYASSEALPHDPQIWKRVDMIAQAFENEVSIL